jgi:hypothetical protein
MAQLTEQIVRECRARWAAGEMQKTLCAEFGISKAQMSRAINGKRWARFPGDIVCPECGKGGLESSRDNTRKFHVACAEARHKRLDHDRPGAHEKEMAQQRARRMVEKAERYAADPAYRERVDVQRLYSMRGRPYLEALSWRVIWTRYRLREPDFLRLLAWQGEICACGKPFDGKPVVDHDHACCPPSSSRRGMVVRDGVERSSTCGKCVRGLLHMQCNFLVGIIETNPDTIQPIGWVEKYLAAPPYLEMCCQLAAEDRGMLFDLA